MKDTVSIIFGDSISYGLYDKESLGWVNRVRLNLTNNHYLFNLAIPGQSSKDILDRFEIELKNRYNNLDNFKLIFAFGIKDALLLSKDNNHINIFKENVLKIIEISKKHTKDINFVGLIKLDFAIRNEYNLEDVIAIDNTLEEICKDNNLNYIKLIDLINEDELTDGLHPNSIGHKKISERILNSIYEV